MLMVDVETFNYPILSFFFFSNKSRAWISEWYVKQRFPPNLDHFTVIITEKGNKVLNSSGSWIEGISATKV